MTTPVKASGAAAILVAGLVGLALMTAGTVFWLVVGALFSAAAGVMACMWLERPRPRIDDEETRR